MYWWRLLLELRLLLLSTAYSVSGSSRLVLGAAALLEPSFKIPGPRSRSQGQVFASGDPTELPLGLAHLGFTFRLLAQQTILVAGRLVPGPQFKFLSTTQPELGTPSPVPGADSLPGPLINILEPLAYLLGLLTYLVRDIHEAYRTDGDMICETHMVYMVRSPGREEATFSLLPRANVLYLE
jgi:hypothetical protein